MLAAHALDMWQRATEMPPNSSSVIQSSPRSVSCAATSVITPEMPAGPFCTLMHEYRRGLNAVLLSQACSAFCLRCTVCMVSALRGTRLPMMSIAYTIVCMQCDCCIYSA